MRAPAAILFDLDGTLIDSHAEIAATLARAVEVCGLPPMPPLPRASIGPPLNELLAAFFAHESTETIARIRAEFTRLYDASDFAATTVFPGAREVLRFGVPSYLATAKRDRPTRRLVAALDLGPFADICCSDSSGTLRSKSEIVGALLRAHALDPSSTWMVGDTSSDLRAARDHGLIAVAAAYGYGSRSSLESEQPDATVESASDLVALVARALGTIR